MSTLASLVLLPQTVYINDGTASPMQITGVPVKAASYYLSNKYLQTISYDLIDFKGTLAIQATLESNIDTEKWFDVFVQTFTNETTTINFINIEGNFVYLRAVLRNFNNGTVNYVRVAY
jgi:hypothetical protein